MSEEEDFLFKPYIMEPFSPDFKQPVANSAEVERKELRKGVPVRKFKTMRFTPSNPVGMGSDTNLSSRVFAQITGVSKPPIVNKAYGLSGIEEASFGHSNLAWYLYTCWAKEMGAVLRPDMFWFTIVNEIAREVKLFPNHYRSLFTASDEKIELTVESREVHVLPIDSLDSLLSDNVPDKVFKACITDVPFVTETSEGFSEVIKASFANMASPFYDYCMVTCGIPEVAVEGEAEDWLAMIQSCKIMSKRFPAGSRLVAYVEHVAKLLHDIHIHAFVSDLSKVEVRQASESFFSGIFWSTDGCGSGSPYYCKGWICQLYNRTTDDEHSTRCAAERGDMEEAFESSFMKRHQVGEITEFPAHISSVELEQMPMRRRFTQISGLFYSKCEGSYFIPFYGTATYELSQKEFEKTRQSHGQAETEKHGQAETEKQSQEASGPQNPKRKSLDCCNCHIT
eukprot:TRINITY_DN4929_c0_g3_i2.p1 TRINITY_DN4929_c0_g3~~TRINITY_DN4929_c0_g3_i2.p1  ORF type:complete len:470 (+),score=82.17 TRINITY_DN4929_c0_g3_i2:54-1412(+)